MSTPADGLSGEQEKKLAVGQTVFVGSQFARDPNAQLAEFKVIAVKRKYFTVSWEFTNSGTYPVDFSLETWEQKEGGSQWVTGKYAKAWASREAFAADVAARHQADEDTRKLREIRSFFAGFRQFNHAEIELIWAAMQKLQEPKEAK